MQIIAGITAVLAKPHGIYPPAIIKNDGYHVSVTQDTLGGYRFRYEAPSGIIREEDRSRNGDVIGSYQYIDPNHETQIIRFSSGSGGYVASGSHIPQPVKDTPEVAAAKQKHLGLLEGVLHPVYGLPHHPSPSYGTPSSESGGSDILSAQNEKFAFGKSLSVALELPKV